MLCAISGESPQDPVISAKSGNVFERRLAEAYISENGKDPVTGEEMTVEDLIDVKTSRVVRPRPPTLTSIPSLLSVFQNEWDAFALESYNLRQQLGQTRQELATALYQHDAAIRVIARLTKERDEARDALSKVTIGAGANNGDVMQVDSAGLPEELVKKIYATHEKLSKSRRKRAVPKEWATPEAVESYTVTSSFEALYPSTTTLALDATGELAIVGGAQGAGIFSIPENKLVQQLNIGRGSVTDAVWYGSQPVVSTSAGAVKVFNDGEEVASFTSHAGAANALALHPTGDILASVGVDKSFVFYDLAASKPVAQVYTDNELTTCAFHPDGTLFALGTATGLITLYHTKTLSFAASFPLPPTTTPSPITSLSFSENGIWFSATAGSTIVVFDLRKEGEAAVLKVFDLGSEVRDAVWDYSGQFLASVGGEGVAVMAYRKKEKSWSEVLRAACPGVRIAWGGKAESLVIAGKEGVISSLGSK